MKKYLDFINEAFKVGDRVKYDTYHQNFDDKTGIEKGTVVGIDEGDILVKFDNAWTDGLHDGDGMDPDFKSYWCSIENLRTAKPPKIIISANDPYGEEDWED